MTVLGEKLGGRPVDHLVGLEVVSGALFLESSRVRPTLVMASKRLSRTETACRKCMWTGAGSIRVVCIGFSPTGCTSIRIAATLIYE
jgi:hypothetical protein